MANEITSSVTSSDQEKFLAAQLVKRAHLKLIAAGLCEKVKQPKGAGLTAYFVRYDRMNLPLAELSEGVPPSSPSPFTVTQYTVTLDQWGDYIQLTDVAELTTKHPLFQQAQELLADNAARVIDREIQLVWLAGTNVQYFDGSRAARSAVISTDKVSDVVLNKARVTMQTNGAMPKQGPDHKEAGEGSGNMLNGQSYVLVIPPAVEADVLAMASSSGGFVAAAQYSAVKKLYNAEIGQWLGFRIVVSNFLPAFSTLGTTTAAVASGASNGGITITAVDGGGSFTSATTYYWVVSRKDKARGFEEAITIPHSTASTATGDNESFTFALPAGSSYVYNIYMGTAADACYLAAENQAAGATVTVTAPPSSSQPLAPVSTSVAAGSLGPTVYACYVHAEGSCKWVGLQDLKVHMTDAKATKDDPLAQFRTLGYKFLAKAVVLDQTRLLRLELASAY